MEMPFPANLTVSERNYITETAQELGLCVREMGEVCIPCFIAITQSLQAVNFLSGCQTRVGQNCSLTDSTQMCAHM